MQNARFKRQTLSARTPPVFVFCILHFAFLALVTGCGAKASAKTVPDGAPLAVPLPPAHEIAIEQIADAPEPPEAAPRPAVTRTPAREAPQPVAAPPAAALPAEVAAVRAAPAAASAADERKVRDLMSRAAAALARVDYRKLSTEGKAQYDQSKRFSEQAQQAIKERNFVYALTLAEKAATLAAELVR